MVIKPPLTWISPLIKQFWVCAGVGLNVAQIGFGFGISSTLVPDLRRPGSPFPIDEECGSWLASIVGITLIPGNLIGPIMMGKCGRKITHISCIVMLAIAWLLTAFAPNITILMIARSLHGICFGIIFVIGPILVGEYTSPTNRGVFLMSLGVLMAAGIVVILAMSLYIAWQTASLICASMAVFTLVIVIFSPESPSWLASKGRYEECRASFRWLRGVNEEAELEKLINSSKLSIEASKEGRSSNDTLMIKLRNQYNFLKSSLRKVEFYLPIVIMMHVSGMAQSSGVSIFTSYAVDLIKIMLGDGVDVPSSVIWLNLQRAVTTTVGLIFIKKVKRRTVMILSVGFNLFVMTLSGVYLCARSHNLLPFDSIHVGHVILHMHMFSIAIGAMPLSLILSGELYPLKYKSLAGGISSIAFSLQIFISLKTVPFLLNTIKLYGTYWLYAGVQLFCLIVTSVLLPETKDKTLQDIEEEFRSKNNHKNVDERYTTKLDVIYSH